MKACEGPATEAFVGPAMRDVEIPITRKRYASHYLRTATGAYLRQQVVEVIDGRVADYFPLEAEIEDVTWLPGVIALERDDCGRLTAYHHYPYDLTTLQPVAATRRRQLP